MRPNKLDWLVYRVFRWWWDPVFRKNMTLAVNFNNAFASWIGKEIEKDPRRSAVLRETKLEKMVRLHNMYRS